MVQLEHLASRLLRFEQQLAAYQKLHTDELAELWRVLNECKREIAAALSNQGLDGDADGFIPAGEVSSKQPGQNEESSEKSLQSTSGYSD